MLRPWLAGSLVAAALVALLPSGATARLQASNFPPSQGLKLIEKDAPSWVGEPAVVTAVQSITGKRFGSVKNRLAHWVTWERPWRDAGNGTFLILRVKSAPAACRYFLSQVDPKDRTKLRRECNRLPATDLSVYGKVSYKLLYREIRSNDRRWRAHEGDDKPLRRTSARRISEYLDRGLLPGHYDARLEVKVGLAPHPLLEFIIQAKEWIDWIKTPFEVAEGPIGWKLEEIKDELITGVVGALRTTKSIYAFDVPAIMPNLAGKRPSQAIKLLRAFQLRPKLVKTTQPGKGVSKVIGQSEAPNTWLLAGTEVAVTYVAYGPSTAPPPKLTWTGTWHTTFGTMNLTQGGNSVTGSYTHDSGRITNATVSGRVLTGTWDEAPSRRPPRDTGPFEFTMSADGRSFTGRWAYADDRPGFWRAGWNGTR